MGGGGGTPVSSSSISLLPLVLHLDPGSWHQPSWSTHSTYRLQIEESSSVFGCDINTFRQLESLLTLQLKFSPPEFWTKEICITAAGGDNLWTKMAGAMYSDLVESPNCSFLRVSMLKLLSSSSSDGMVLPVTLPDPRSPPRRRCWCW